MQHTADILFDYIKDILYRPDDASLDHSVLPPDYQKLGQALDFLADCVRETRSFGKALAKGDLSQKLPSGNNVLAAPMKELHSSLRHLAWQTQEVAKGDYSQTVDFMGEFSEAFNTMTHQLKERQEGLIAEKQVTEVQNKELEYNLDLVMSLMRFIHNMIFVYSIGSKELLFTNETAKWFLKTRPESAERVLERIHKRETELYESSPFWQMEFERGEDSGGMEYYEVESHRFSYGGKMAMVHILMDATERRAKENLMYKLAYVDPLTGLKNRRYMTDLLKRLRTEAVSFVMSVIDVDNLKYCNDTFGHKTGDEYLTKVSAQLKTLGGSVCRIGGDEFVIIQPGITAKSQNQRLERLRTVLSEESGLYPQSFSYASSDIIGDSEKSVEDCLNEIDEKMYEYKQVNKKPLSDLFYHDERLSVSEGGSKSEEEPDRLRDGLS